MKGHFLTYTCQSHLGGEMVPSVKGLAIESEDLRLTPRTHRVKGENSCKLSSNLHTRNMAFVYLNTRHINVEIKTKIPSPSGEVFLELQLSEEWLIMNS